MFKVIVDNKIVDLLSNEIKYVLLMDNEDFILSNADKGNAVMGVFGNVYQIKNRKNIQSEKYPICSLLSIEQNEFDEIYEQLSSNVVLVNEEVQEDAQTKADEPQAINLLNEITELKAKLNELLNK